MSGALSVFSTAASTINAIGAMAFGATGGVVLGDFSFAGMEVPEFITIGGAQKTTVHTLPGGERIVDLLGHEDHDLEWHGIIIDGDPSSRARELDQMRIDGPALPLQWGEWYFTVLVKEFRAETRYSQLHYRISCLVLVNPRAPTPEPEPDTQDAVSSDLGTAESAAPDAVKPSVATARQSLPEPPIPPDSAAVENQGMDTATGATVPAPNERPPPPNGIPPTGPIFGPQQPPTTPLPPQPAFSDPAGNFGPPTAAPPVSATVGTQGGLMPPPSVADVVTSPFVN